MQLKDVTQIIKAILEERDKIPLMINTERYIPDVKLNQHGTSMRGGLRKALRIIEQAPTIDAVEVVRCKDCVHRHSKLYCPMCDLLADMSEDEGFCHCGEKEEE